MKKSIRTLSFLLAAMLLVLSFAACSNSNSDTNTDTNSGIVGTYSGSYVYNNNNFDITIKLKEDGTYTDTTKQDGTVVAVEEGEYEVKDNSVFLYIPTDEGPRSSWTKYAYKDGTLTNNGHVFTKE